MAPPPQKRSRVALACNPCRERKARCNGANPICGRCLRRGLTEAECSYTPIPGSSRNVSQEEYIAHLQNRIRRLESEARSNERPESSNGRDESILHTPRRLPSTSSYSKSTPQLDQLALSPQAAVVQAVPPLETSSYSVATENNMTTESLMSDEPSPAAPVDNHMSAMGADISGLPPESPTTSFYGSSSISSLLAQIHQMTDRSRKGHTRLAHSLTISQPASGGRVSSGAPEAISASRIHAFYLPPRHVADHLIDLYFTGVHCYYPWLHTQSFLNAYNQLWTPGNEQRGDAHLPRVGLGGRNCPRTLFYCALNTIFALGCEFSASTENTYQDLSAGFMDHAYNLLRLDTLDDGDLSGVQTLLLLATHLQRTQYPMRCWIVTGIALRIAQEIGLEFSHEGSNLSSLEIEMRRRTWHGCMLLDALVSMTLGRVPTPRAELKVPLFLPIDDKFLSASSATSTQPEGIFSRIAFAVENVKLGEIICLVLKKIYGGRGPNNSSESILSSRRSFDSILDLESSVSEFERNIPIELKGAWSSVSDEAQDTDSRILQCQSFVLRARLLHAKLLIYRPAFCDFCKSCPLTEPREGTAGRRISADGDERPESLLTSFNARCAVACLDNACKIVELLNEAWSRGRFGAWWYGVFYLVTGSMILILSESSPSMRLEIGAHRIEEIWKKSQDTLKFLSRQHPEASQCATALQIIRRNPLNTKKKAAAARDSQTNPYQQGSQHHQIIGTDPTAGASEVRPFVNFEDPLQHPISHGMFDEMPTMTRQMNTTDETTGLWSDSSPPISLDTFDIPETMWCAFDLDFSMPVSLS